MYAYFAVVLKQTNDMKTSKKPKKKVKVADLCHCLKLL